MKFLFFLILILPTLSVNASTYQCLDESGEKFVYQNSPCELSKNRTLNFNTIRNKAHSAPSDKGNRMKNTDSVKAEEKNVESNSTTTKDAVACLKAEWLNDLIKFSISKDEGSIEAYMGSKCIFLKSGLKVTVTESPGMFGGTVGFAYKGIKFWTTRESLDYQ